MNVRKRFQKRITDFEFLYLFDFGEDYKFIRNFHDKLQRSFSCRFRFLPQNSSQIFNPFFESHLNPYLLLLLTTLWNLAHLGHMYCFWLTVWIFCLLSSFFRSGSVMRNPLLLVMHFHFGILVPQRLHLTVLSLPLSFVWSYPLLYGAFAFGMYIPSFYY